jgi:CRP-like cAMP-binding protein
MVGVSIFPGGNALIQALEPAVLEKFSPRFSAKELKKGDTLQDTGETVDSVYFPISGLIGLFSETPDGDCVLTAMLGREGALGAFAACGSRKAMAKALVQIPGKAWCLPASTYRDLFVESEALRTAIHKHVEFVLAEARQFATCNALHTTEARLCRAILQARERSVSGTLLPLTQATFAQMLGVQRTTITMAVNALQANKLIRVRRGGLELLDLKGLERSSCACREAIQFAADEIRTSPERACSSAS